MGRVVVAGVCPNSISGLPVAVSIGSADLGPGTGTDGGVIGIACTGASPRSGSNGAGSVRGWHPAWPER